MDFTAASPAGPYPALELGVLARQVPLEWCGTASIPQTVPPVPAKQTFFNRSLHVLEACRSTKGIPAGD